MTNNFLAVKIGKMASLALVALLVFSASSADGQIVIDGNDIGVSYYENRNNIETAAVYDNGHVVGTHLVNYDTIGQATVNHRGSLRNFHDIGTAIVNSRGTLHNYDDATITRATVNGTLVNNATITRADINSGGRVDNLAGSIISATLDGGTVNNANRIVNLTYTSGIYTREQNGSIGTLTLAGNSASNLGTWGAVGDLRFDSNGGGIVSIEGFAVGDSFEIGFSGIQATNRVDLEHGHIFLDMSDFDFLGTFNSFEDWENAFFGMYCPHIFTFENLFGTGIVDNWNALTYFELAWGRGADSIMRIFDGTSWYGDWGITSRGITAAIPEPATLAIVGLGLVGLGLVRRRR